MKHLIKRIIRVFAKHKIFWIFFKPVIQFSELAKRVRYEETKKTVKSSGELDIPHFLQGKTVLNGVFTGLKYPETSSVGSALLPKLLGSYELEIQGDIEDLIKNNQYTEILDVGCAEGYYAIGLAMKNPKSRIYAFDTNKEARELCQKMARINNIGHQIQLKSTLQPDQLENFHFTGKGLIICDCEGYEVELFNPSNIKNLKNCDLIIETHDFKNIDISSYLKDLFSKSHTIKSIFSIDDIHKVYQYDFPQLKGLSLIERKTVMREWRPAIMEWLICTPITND